MRWILLLLIACVPAAAQCGSAEDRLTYVRERLAASPSAADLQDIYSYLVGATRSCYSSGDLWHYRSLVEERISRPTEDVKYSKKKAADLTSLALRQQVDPFTAPPADAGAPVPAFVQDKWALVIGIGSFADSGISRLRYTAKDAKDLAAALEDPKIGRFPAGHVHTLIDGQATMQGIRDELTWLRENAKPADLVLIYIASHGSPKTLDVQGVGLSYIVTHDTMLNRLYARAYPMVDLVQQVNRDLAARRVVLFLDACHSGSAVTTNTVRAAQRSLQAEGVESVNQAFAQLRTSTGRAVMVSSRAEETSWENQALDEGKGNGYFTRFLIEGLKQKEGLAPLKDVFAYVREKVSARVMADLKKQQTPMFQAAEQGDGIIVGVAPKVGSARIEQPKLVAASAAKSSGKVQPVAPSRPVERKVKPGRK